MCLLKSSDKTLVLVQHYRLKGSASQLYKQSLKVSATIQKFNGTFPRSRNQYIYQLSTTCRNKQPLVVLTDEWLLIETSGCELPEVSNFNERYEP